MAVGRYRAHKGWYFTPVISTVVDPLQSFFNRQVY